MPRLVLFKKKSRLYRPTSGRYWWHLLLPPFGNILPVHYDNTVVLSGIRVGTPPGNITSALPYSLTPSSVFSPQNLPPFHFKAFGKKIENIKTLLLF